MSKKLFFLISVIIVLALAAPAAADELMASYENSEYESPYLLSVTTHPEKDPTLTVTKVLASSVGLTAPDGDYILKWVWTDETQGENPRKIEIEHNWATKAFDLAGYNLITADVWFDEPSAQPATIGIWNMDIYGTWPDGVFWAPALSVPYGLNQWHTVEMDIGGADVHDYWDGNDLTCLFAFLFEDVAGDSGVIYTDNMWLRFVRQVKAWRPIPFDGAVSMDPNVDLSWEAGLDAISHDVYFGSSWSEVNDANNSLPVGTSVYKGNQALGNTSYDPGTLERWKTYYWRIDEVNDPNVKGDIWSFKTAPEAYVEIPLVSYEDSETHYSVWTGLNISGDFDDSLVLGDKLAGGSTWGGVTVPTATDGDNVLGLMWTNEQDLEVEHGCTFEGSDFRYDLYGIDEMVFDVYYAPNDSQGGFNPLPHVMGVFDWRFAPSFNGSSNLPTTRGVWHTIVIDVSHLNNVGLDSIYDFEFMAHGEDFDPCGADPNNWGALMFMDNLRLHYVATPYATLPSPGHEATGVDLNADLSWRKGTDANSHDVYFGTSFAEVNDANNSLPVGTSVYKGNQPLADVNYEPGLLDPSRTYYWRIDEVNDPNVKGNVWNFTTADYKVIDDFDSYDVTIDLLPETKDLRDVWEDYHELGGLGCMVKLTGGIGNPIGPNTSPPHSMLCKYSLDKTGPYETRRTYADDGLLDGSEPFKALVLWFYGETVKKAVGVWTPIGEIYVTLKDSAAAGGDEATVHYGDASCAYEGAGDVCDLIAKEWLKWGIPLSAFEAGGVDLDQIKSIAIGASGGSGRGDIYFDDILFYERYCHPEYSWRYGDFTGDCFVDNDDLDIMANYWLIGDYNVGAEAPSDANLVAWYKFDGDLLDSSAPAHNGAQGPNSLNYAAGKIGPNSLDLDGDDDYVVITGSNTPGGPFDINDAITVSAWIKVSAFDKYFNTIIAKGDDSWRLARASETETGNGVEFACSGISNNEYGSISGSINVDDGQWHHVAGVYDGSKICIYVDGILDNREKATGAINNGSYNVYIGENEQVPGREWNGLIDDVRIYDYGLSHAEIVSLAGESEVYQPVLPLANLYDEESKFSKKINFKDYAVMANRWLEQLLFPFE